MPHNGGPHGAVAGANEGERRKKVEVPKPAPGRPRGPLFPKVPQVPAPKDKRPPWARDPSFN